MKKLINYLIAIAFAFAVNSCGLFGGYDAERAEEIIDKYKDDESLTNEDYADAISICDAGFNEFIDRLEDALAAGDKAEKKDALKMLEDDDEFCDMFDKTWRLYQILYNADEYGDNELNSENKKDFKALEKLYKKLEKLGGKVDDIYPQFDLD